MRVSRGDAGLSVGFLADSRGDPETAGGSGGREDRTGFRIHVVSTTKRRYREAHGVVALPPPRIDAVDGVERARQTRVATFARARIEQTIESRVHELTVRDVVRASIVGSIIHREWSNREFVESSLFPAKGVADLVIVREGRDNNNNKKKKPCHRRSRSTSPSPDDTFGVIEIVVRRDDSRVTTYEEETTKTRKREKTVKWTLAIARGCGRTIAGRGDPRIQGYRPQPARGNDASRVRRKR